MPWNSPITWAVGDVLTSPDMNAYVRDNFEYLFPGPWTSLPYNNSATDYGAGNAPGQFRKIGDEVVMQGLANAGTSPAASVATLPVGFRPVSGQQFSALSDQSKCHLVIDAAGNVGANGFPAAVTYVSFAGVRFSTI